MRYSVCILIFKLISLILCGQSLNDTLIQKKTVDSLYKEIFKLKDENNSLDWNNRINSKGVKIDTTLVRADSSVFYYYSEEGNLILQEVVEFSDKQRWIPRIKRYFDDLGREAYTEYWIVLYNSRWDAQLEKKERIQYDKLGRIVLKAIYYYKYKNWTERTEYWYDTSGEQHNRRIISDDNIFWK